MILVMQAQRVLTGLEKGTTMRDESVNKLPKLSNNVNDHIRSGKKTIALGHQELAETSDF